MFDNEVPHQWRFDLLNLIADTPQLDWLLLTKRIGNAQAMLDAFVESDGHKGERWDVGWRNVWLGITICNQTEADRDIPKLLAVPAVVRFISVEPMLGQVDLGAFLWTCCGDMQPGNDHGLLGQESDHCCGRPNTRDALDWIICGGESGPNARPMHPDWARSLRDQCAAAGVPFHFKQWGEWEPGCGPDGEGPTRHRWLGGAYSTKVGTKAAGRLLDGIEHNGFPA